MHLDATQASRGRRLDSWKEIAAYLGRDVRTVQRWEHSDELPVRRLQHAKLASVYAYTDELDEWRLGREPGEPIAETTPPKPWNVRRLWFVAGIAAAVALGAAVALWPRRAVERPAGTAPIRTVAVLPIANFSGDPQQEYFADGMTDALIARLSTVPGLLVISRTSVMPFKQSQRRIPEIAKTLNVQGIVEGSVTRSEGRVRITVKLIRAATDTTLWADVFDRENHDVLGLQSDVAQAIARQVETSLSQDELARLAATRPVAPEAFENYLKGSFLLQKDSGPSSEEAIRLFEASIGLDPTFAPAYLGLARAYESLGTYFIGGRSPLETRPKSVAAAKEALRLDPDSSGGHTLVARADQREFRWAAAEAGYRRAIRLNPSDSGAHGQLADLLVCLGRFDEAIATARRSRDIDPLSLGGGLNFGMVLYFARRDDDAIRELRALRALYPDDPRLLWYLGNSLMAASHVGEAVELLERSVARERLPGPLGFLAIAYARAGRQQDAERVVAELTSRARKSYVPPAAFVAAYTAVGDIERAFAALERAYDERSNLVRSLKVLPILDPLRPDPRFADLLRRTGLD